MLPCPNCGGELLLAADCPHPRLSGCTYVKTLCPVCDVDDETAQGLLAFFVVNPVLDAEHMGTLELLVWEWITRSPGPPQVSVEAFESDVRAYLNGEFD